ncbi:MAG: 50S ribosomal protein L15 [Candidatus Omnitrophota bacterium]|jgi:large subunit ribosomal protein L15
MDLSNIKVRVKNKGPKRVGRGTGSGLGKTSGRGHKGAGQRKGKVLPYIGFRGGNLPLARKLPKRGFNPPKRKIYQIVNLIDIQEKLADVSDITPVELEKAGLIKSKIKPIKILASAKGDFKLKIVCKADKFSVKAKEIIEAAGGKTECLSR